MNTLKPGSPVLFMKVGVHANEGLSSIINRKTEEIARSGFSMWGYGGACHPLTVVRPFATSYATAGTPIKLVMEEIESHHDAAQIAADEYSIDDRDWKEIDTNIHKVLGSKYALFIDDLHAESCELDLSQTKVALGPCRGYRGDNYIRGRVDKACLILNAAEESLPSSKVSPKQIKLVANLIPPYAAKLRYR